MGILEKIKSKILILDGAMGTMLQEQGLATGEHPEVFNMTQEAKIEEIHRQYIEAGSQLVLTNTFGANALKLQGTGYETKEIILKAVALAKRARGEKDAFIGLDIGPLGELLEPMGTLSFLEAYELFKEQVLAGVEAGVDCFFIETMTDLGEMRCALLAVKENSQLPVFCTMSFEENMHTFVGTSISSMALTLEGLGADAVGINCSLGPKEMYPMVLELRKWTNLPLIVKPNAGLPNVVQGKTVFNVFPEEFSQDMEKILDLGVNIIGGCCGTSPSYIEKLSLLGTGRTFVPREEVKIAGICSASKTVLFDRVRIIGERINPTGKKLFQEALKNNNLDYILGQGISQVEAGADILDVNVGLPGIDEASAMVSVVKGLQSVLDTPLQIDSSNPKVIEAALRIYNGKALVNSVNGERETLELILPIVKKYGAAVVGLTLDKEGIPKVAEERLKIATRILEASEELGIHKENVLIDCLTLTAAAEQEQAYETIRALALVKEKLGLKTVLGVSNISFGLPARGKINQVFLTAALANGLDLPIINPNIKEMVDTIFCFHQLVNIDKGSREYLERFSQEVVVKESFKGEKDIAFYIKNGLKEETKGACQKLLKELPGLTIVNEFLMPALDQVGADYESNKIFLPQLIQSAEAAKGAFELIRAQIAKQEVGEVRAGHKIILATVEGDIHDIGKNIVKVILENYGYDILDLGRDVAIEKVVEAARKQEVHLVGLSALMTTTVANMEQTIKELKETLPGTKIMVGGAVVTSEIAKNIGADFYAQDAMSAVAIVKEYFNEGNEK